MSNTMTAGLAPIHPGEVLGQIVLPAMKRGRGEIAQLLGMSRQHLYDITRGRKPITPRTALKLARLVGGTAQTWLRMQEAFDLRTLEREMAAELASMPRLLAA